MNIDPILQAPLAVKVHLATVLPAFAIGTWQIFGSAKGSRPHRAWGMTYMVLMVVTAVAAYFIREVGRGSLSPIHLFIPLTFFGVFGALWSAHKGDIKGHRNAMLGLYIGGLLLAGAFALMPGRIMHQFFFG
jgi:uncharacterized membrane protein